MSLLLLPLQKDTTSFIPLVTDTSLTPLHVQPDRQHGAINNASLTCSFPFSPFFQRRPYSFTYGVRDEISGTDFHREEESSGPVTRGSYKVALPDGRIQIVEYVADDSGYKATVSYEGEPIYPKPSEYRHKHVKQPVPHHPPHQPHVVAHPHPHPHPPQPHHKPLSNAIYHQPASYSPPPPPTPTYGLGGVTVPFHTTLRPHNRHKKAYLPSPSEENETVIKIDREKPYKRPVHKFGRKKSEKPKKRRGGNKKGGILPKFANFEPAPEHALPDGTKALTSPRPTTSSVEYSHLPASRHQFPVDLSRFQTTTTPKPSTRNFTPTYLGPYPTRKTTTTTPAPDFTRYFPGPYAPTVAPEDPAYVKPTTYRPKFSKDFFNKIRKRGIGADDGVDDDDKEGFFSVRSR